MLDPHCSFDCVFAELLTEAASCVSGYTQRQEQHDEGHQVVARGDLESPSHFDVSKSGYVLTGPEPRQARQSIPTLLSVRFLDLLVCYSTNINKNLHVRNIAFFATYQLF